MRIEFMRFGKWRRKEILPSSSADDSDMSGLKFGRRKSRDALKSRLTFTNRLKKCNLLASAVASIISWFWFPSTILRHKLCLLRNIVTLVPGSKTEVMEIQRNCRACYRDWLDLGYLSCSSSTHIYDWTNHKFFHYRSVQTNYWVPLHRCK